jgi:long-subunit acyl-CoA synthetase (AMP-forming)
MVSVVRDGATLGEIVLRASSVMKVYYKNPESTTARSAAGDS